MGRLQRVERGSDRQQLQEPSGYQLRPTDHGLAATGGSDPEKQVHVISKVSSAAMRIEITDQGKGFDPESLPDPLASENLLRPNGRGIFFMKRYMDDIDHTFKPGVGMVVTLKKRVTMGASGLGQVEEEDEE